MNKTMFCRVLKTYKYELLLCALVLLMGIVIFTPFFFGHFVMVYQGWGYDSYNQYIPYFEIWCNKIRDGRLGIYDLSAGLGTDLSCVFPMFNPFYFLQIMLAVFIGNSFIANSMAIFTLLKILCLTLLGYRYLRLFYQNQLAVFVSALSMGFSGYVIVTIPHYWFLDIAVYYMLTLLLVEKVISDGKRFFPHLVLSVAMFALYNPYGLFQTCLVAGLYVLLRGLVLRWSVKEYFSYIMVLIGALFSGIAIGAVFLFHIFIRFFFAQTGYPRGWDYLIN